MHLSNATATTLLLAFTRLTNPSKDATKIPEYYNTQIMPSFAAAHNATLALGYTILPPVNASTPSKWTYLAVYKTSANATVSAPRVEGGSRAGEGEIGPEDVETEVSAWSPVQVFEGLREKRGDVPAGRPGVACVVRIEPGEGDGKGEARVEDWYRFQHLDMLSMLPNYRRSTRYRSRDGSKPRWLAVHEMDSDYVDPYVGAVLMDTELAHGVMDTVEVFDAANWKLGIEEGDVAQKL